MISFKLPNNSNVYKVAVQKYNEYIQLSAFFLSFLNTPNNNIPEYQQKEFEREAPNLIFFIQSWAMIVPVRKNISMHDLLALLTKPDDRILVRYPDYESKRQ